MAFLHGFPNPLPSSESGISWNTAKIWDDELEQRHIQRPRTISGIAGLSDVFWLSEQICHFLLCDATVLKHRTAAQIDRDRDAAEKLLIKYMEAQGF